MGRPFSIQDDDISVQVRSPSKPRVAKLLMLCEKPYTVKLNTDHKDQLNLQTCILMHAKLMSNIQSSKPCRAISHYTSFCYWRDTSKSLRTIDNISSTILKQLTSRAVVHIFIKINYSTSGIDTMKDRQRIESDVIRSCTDFIEDEYDNYEHGDFSRSFIDAFDLFAAGVILIVCLRRTQQPSASGKTGIFSRCATLLTILGERFAALRVLHRILSALSTLGLEGFCNDQVCPESVRLTLKSDELRALTTSGKKRCYRLLINYQISFLRLFRP
jgi:hypothetical protein